jgi:hypothetical protein
LSVNPVVLKPWAVSRLFCGFRPRPGLLMSKLHWNGFPHHRQDDDDVHQIHVGKPAHVIVN